MNHSETKRVFPRRIRQAATMFLVLLPLVTTAWSLRCADAFFHFDDGLNVFRLLEIVSALQPERSSRWDCLLLVANDALWNFVGNEAATAILSVGDRHSVANGIQAALVVEGAEASLTIVTLVENSLNCRDPRGGASGEKDNYI